ncbi:branched-chain amino acid transport system II carrier protein [Lentibacillus saliphilus]|uniref:branched-chain amino acid transport system II carrier protein n=1 Tax=Lentibacillus saliphilus TaxID=2737028 RepID=UPI001C2FD570|nr:branched-chain amino acid transport system II carrier protein [Lentibacillus saliphilus]
MNKSTFIIGFMLFALFFGAGNLIYPPMLGLEAGTSFWSAITGFVITGVGLPIFAVAAIALVKSDERELSDRVHPIFGLIFTSLIYLAIAPFFGIPRAASVAYEMSVEPFIQTSPWMLFLFTGIFFVLVLIVSLNPAKIVDRIGQLLTPILLLSIVVLIVGAVFVLDTPFSEPSPKYASAPFFKGFVEGYLTMDAIGALAFGIIVVSAYRNEGITKKSTLIKETLKSGLITGLGLVLVYVSIGWIGAKMGTFGTFSNGGDILSAAAEHIFGSFGALLLGVIVALACFTTSVGLVVAAGQFFSRITKLSYGKVAVLVTLVSFIIANQGLNTIISISVPVLVFLYPIAIAVIILAFLYPFLQHKQSVYRGTIFMTALFSLYDGLTAFGFDLSTFKPFMVQLPLFAAGLGWLVPAIIGGIFGHVIGAFNYKKA